MLPVNIIWLPLKNFIHQPKICYFFMKNIRHRKIFIFFYKMQIFRSNIKYN